MTTRSVRVLLPLAVLAPCAGADVTPADHFGAGCDGASGLVPELTTPQVVVVGEDFAVEVEAGPNLVGELHLALQKDTWLGFTLPLELEFFGAPSCNLLVPPDVTAPIATDGDGRATLILPSFPAGTTVYLQALLYDTDPADFDPLVALSDGVELSSVAPSGVEPGDLIVTEIMANPSFVADSQGEWIEVYNATAEPLDLRGWCLTDDSNQRVVLSADAPIEVDALSWAVLGNNGDPTTNGGVSLLHDWSADGTYTLSSPSDVVRLVAPDGAVADEVAYGGSGWANPIGRSLELAEGLLDHAINDQPEVWEVAVCYVGGSGATFNTDRGTPGQAAGTCEFPTIPSGSGELIFNEVMQNPSQVADAVGEWFEVLNTTAADLDLDGYSFSLGGGTFTVEGTLVVPAGGVQLFARVGDPSLNGGLPAGAYDYPDALFLPNGSQSLSIADSTGALLCLITYDNGSTYPDPSGASIALDPAAADLQGATDGSSWCEGSTAYGDGDLGSPGAPNPPCGG